MTICHYGHTITVTKSQVSAHLAHGDYLGACHTSTCHVCSPGSTASCYDGAAGTQGVGVCRAGTKTCNSAGSAWGACTGQVTPSTEVCTDAADNDCDGSVNEGCVCVPGTAAGCYGGTPGTSGVGACHDGTKTCNASGSGFGSCGGAVTPVTEVCGDGVDNDCDGTADEGCFCAPGSTADCYDGEPGTAGVGTCAAGTKTCNAAGSAYGACTGETTPGPETCDDGLDNNCNHIVDEGCFCTAESTTQCYTGPGGTAGVGVCAWGVQTCNAVGTGFGPCVGDITPSADVCGDGVDNDCDGVVDRGCVCDAGSTEACYHGPAGTRGVGTCADGSRTCNDTGTAWGECQGEVRPAAETCYDGLDNNCDGVPDDRCVCEPDSTALCYTGPAGTAGVGTCAWGVQTCNPDGTGYEACVNDVTPTFDVCGDSLDNDCDGAADSNCECAADSEAGCYDGPEGTNDVGTCVSGIHVCNATGTAYGPCDGEVTPVDEVCYDDLDNNCDSVVDEECVCTRGSEASCYDGPAGTGGVGACAAGIQRCNPTGTGYEACVGETTPSDEVCGDDIDNDCNGEVDDGCGCVPGSVLACYDGAEETEGVGICVPGLQLCGLDGRYGPCLGEVVPTATPDECDDMIDNDCDGEPACVCFPGDPNQCYTGPAGTEDVGTCVAGMVTCNEFGSGYGPCEGEVTPSPDICGDFYDNDCDGATDEGCGGSL